VFVSFSAAKLKAEASKIAKEEQAKAKLEAEKLRAEAKAKQDEARAELKEKQIKEKAAQEAKKAEEAAKSAKKTAQDDGSEKAKEAAAKAEQGTYSRLSIPPHSYLFSSLSHDRPPLNLVFILCVQKLQLPRNQLLKLKRRPKRVSYGSCVSTVISYLDWRGSRVSCVPVYSYVCVEAAEAKKKAESERAAAEKAAQEKGE